MTFRSTILGALVASAALAGIASAAELRVGSPPPSAPAPAFTLINVCANPLPSTCADPKLYQTTPAAGTCAAQQQSVCGARMQGQYESQFHTLGVPRAALDLNNDVTLHPADDGVDTAGVVKGRFSPFAGALKVITGTDPTYEGQHLATIIGMQNPAGSTATIGGAYVADGTTVSTCQEYTYKRFWDFERFREDELSCRGVPLCVYNAAYGVAGHGFPIANKTLKERNGTTPLDSQIPLRSGVYPKNAFFAVPADLLATPMNVNDGSTLSLISAIFKFGGGPSYYAINQPNAQAKVHYANEWLFWQAMHDGSLSTTEAQFEDQTRRTNNFRELVGAYMATLAQLSGAQASATWQPFDPGRFVDGDSIDWGNRYVGMAGVLVKNGAIATSSFPGLAVGTGPVGGGYVVQSLSTSSQLNTIIGAIQSALVTEYRRGPDSCLLAPTACDWSPREFANHVTDQYKHQIEAAYSDCVDMAGPGTFTSASLDPLSNAPSPASDVPPMKTWIDAERKKLRADFMFVPHYPGKPLGYVGDRTSSGATWGDPNLFGAGVDYDWGWVVQKEAQNASGDTCAFYGDIDGTLTTKVDVFGGSFSVATVNAGFNVDPVKNKSLAYATLDLFGASVYGFADAEPAMHTWSQPILPGNSVDFLTVTYPILVAGVPITVGASLEGTYGIGLTADVGASNACTDGSPPLNGKPNPKFGAHLQLDPYVGVHAKPFAMVGVNAFGVGLGVGVKGDVTLVQVDVPIKTGFDIGADPYATKTGLGINFNVSGDVNFTELAGEVDLFEQYIFGESDQKLFGWPGETESVGMFTPVVWQLPLDAFYGVPSSAP